MSQLGNFANFFAYLFMGLPAGIILKNKGYKFTALSAIAVGFIGVGIQLISGMMPYEKGGDFVPVFSVYLTGAFVSGFSMAMLNTVVNPLLNTLGGGGKKGNQLIQFGGSVNSLAATIVPILGGYLIADATKATLSDAIPALLIAMGIFALAFIVLSMVKIPEPHLEKKSDKKAAKDKYSAMSFRHFVLGTIAIFLYVGVEVGIPNFINLFLTAAQSVTDGASGMGIDAGAAGTVVGTYWFLMLIGRLIGGTIGGKISAKTQLTFVSVLALILVVTGIFLPTNISVSMPVFKADISFGMQVVPLSVVLFVLCGLCTSIMWGGIFNLAVEGIGKYTAMGSGIFMVMVVGGGVLPLIQGAVADITVSYLASYWVIVAALVYMLWYALAGCKNVNKDIPVE
ncbi:L-fucose-proton symporter [bioreactor metagenome]|uniref:L-fucose-proton symporter n=1 Tax=bioreactor metagenome TaxID=1076179 RepID=A0A645DDK0_9ZZZZ